MANQTSHQGLIIYLVASQYKELMQLRLVDYYTSHCISSASEIRWTAKTRCNTFLTAHKTLDITSCPLTLFKQVVYFQLLTLFVKFYLIGILFNRMLTFIDLFLKPFISKLVLHNLLFVSMQGFLSYDPIVNPQKGRTNSQLADFN